MNYKYADIVIRDMNKRNLRAFDRLKTLKFDELNVFRMVSSVYEQSIELAKKRYLAIVWDAYIAALIEAGIPKSKADDMADDDIMNDWVLDMLEDYDEVTLYRFLPEADRKKDRLVEALIASHNKNEEIDKALKLWSRQVAQFADNAVMMATIHGYKDAGVEKVRWVSEKDERVCPTCDERDGHVYPIDKIPPVPHPRCRCILVPIK